MLFALYDQTTVVLISSGDGQYQYRHDDAQYHFPIYRAGERVKKFPLAPSSTFLNKSPEFLFEKKILNLAMCHVFDKVMGPEYPFSPGPKIPFSGSTYNTYMF